MRDDVRSGTPEQGKTPSSVCVGLVGVPVANLKRRLRTATAGILRLGRYRCCMRCSPLPLLLFALPAALWAQSPATPPSIQPPRVETSIVVDGQLDEAVWQRATRLDGFRQFQPVDSRPAEDSTVVLVWYSPTAIHFGIRAYDRVPESVRATVSDRDNIGNDDQVTIYLDTFNDRRRAYFFAVNPYGIQDDGVRSEGGFTASSGGSGTTDRNPDFIWQSKGMKTDYGWVAEIRVPFKSLRWSAGGDLTWGLNVSRLTRRTGYEDTWTDVRRANASFLAQAGMITGLEGISRGVVTEIQPTFTADFPGVRLADGSYDRLPAQTDVGANLRFGFTQLTLDATINPDFSQVESDAGLVTINERFALFFPERRPFFLEGIELFASPNNLVYTRTVANPLAGTKLTGKFGAWTIAHLTALDEFGQARDGGVTDETQAIVNLTRLRRDVGANSVAGVTVTNRDEDGDYNRVVSADTRLLFNKLYYVQAQAGASFTRDARDDDVRVDPLWELETDRTGRAWGYNYKVSAIGDDFETWSGFVNRTGIVSARGFNRLALYGRRGALIESATLFGGVTRILDYNAPSSRALEGTHELSLSARVRGGWNVSGRVDLSFVRFDSTMYAGYAVVGPDAPQPFPLADGVFNAPNTSVTVSTPTWRLWQGSLTLQRGTRAIFPEAAEGTGQSVSASLTLRPTPAVRVFGTLAMQQLDRTRDGSEFARTILPRVKAEFQPNQAVFFRVVAEYRNERQAALVDPVSGIPLVISGTSTAARENNRLRVDWLASYEPTPGTVAFLGYGSTLAGDRALTFSGLERRDDGFFVKLAYLFRR